MPSHLIFTIDIRPKTDGLFLFRASKGGAEFVLTLCHQGGLQHYKIEALDGERVQLLDPANGNRPFNTLHDLVKFYKLYDPEATGGLAARLTRCIPLSLL